MYVCSKVLLMDHCRVAMPQLPQNYMTLFSVAQSGLWSVVQGVVYGYSVKKCNGFGLHEQTDFTALTLPPAWKLTSLAGLLGLNGFGLSLEIFGSLIGGRERSCRYGFSSNRSLG